MMRHYPDPGIVTGWGSRALHTSLSLSQIDICIVLVKHFSWKSLAEGYVSIILVYRCFHCNNPELIVWKLHQSRALAVEGEYFDLPLMDKDML